ncbi:MAG: hypothetical protein IIC85_05185, partial [Chloroflexi bacterium]|nr:hypothetical protein [Chloroflexota bacterium]
MLKRKLLVAAIVGAGAGLSVSPALAHAFGDRYDLPIPLNFFLVGAAATVALSFVVIGVFVKRGSETIGYPRYNLLGAGLPGAFLGSRVFIGMIRLIAVAIFALVVATALFGTGKPLGNLSPTFVWIIWWVGIGYVSALAGNLWRLVNPWKIVFEWAEALTGRGGRPGESSGLFRYPEGWGVWPAVVLFLIFAWLENVYPGAVIPGQLGLLIILYSLVTWAGMVVFGKHTWLKHGEAFSVLFGFFARFSPTEVRVSDSRQCRTCELGCNPTGDDCVDCYACFERAEPGQRQFNLRPFAVGLAQPETVSTSTAFFVVLALASLGTLAGGIASVWTAAMNEEYSRWFSGPSRQAITCLAYLLLRTTLTVSANRPLTTTPKAAYTRRTPMKTTVNTAIGTCLSVAVSLLVGGCPQVLSCEDLCNRDLRTREGQCRDLFMPQDREAFGDCLDNAFVDWQTCLLNCPGGILS